MTHRKPSQVLDLDEETPAPPTVAIEDAEAPPAVANEDGKARKLPDGAVLNRDGTVTYTLAEPVTLTVRSSRGERQETYKSLTFRGLRGSDLRALMTAKDDAAAVIALARSTGIREGVMNVLFDHLALQDIEAATDIIGFFGSNGRRTGR